MTPSAPGELRLEPVRVDHAEALQRLASDPEVAGDAGLHCPYPDGEADRWIEGSLLCRRFGTERAFAVVHRAHGVIGTIALKGIRDDDGSAQLTYWLGRPFWGHGYATRAGRLALGFAFGRLDLDRLDASAFAHNTRSIRVLSKLGFSPVRFCVEPADTTVRYFYRFAPPAERAREARGVHRGTD